jgi:hypothetical protein
MRLQRAMYDRLKGYARDFLGKLHPELRRYFLEYQREFTEIKGVSSKQELFDHLYHAHIAICGDYHTLAQAQRTVIRLLRESLKELRNRGRRVVLGLEMIRFRDTPVVAEFLAGRIDEAGFLRAIGFRRNWGFNWDNYRPLFEFARQNGIPILGINSERRPGGREPSLRQRDRFAARVIGSVTERDPAITVIALIGDLHLAAPHLPAALRTEFRRRKVERQVTVIHQNHERLYWKLAARRLEHRTEVVKLREGVFCIMNTPPWVKLQSYLRWQELVAERSGESTAGPQAGPAAAATAADAFGDLDYSDEIRELVGLLRQFLGIPPAEDDDFRIASPADLGFLERLDEEAPLSRMALRILGRCLVEFESFYIPDARILFLSSLSLNQTASLAAIYLHAKIGGAVRLFEHPRADFYPSVWIEALGFLGSRLVNPRRKCAVPEDWRSRAGASGLPAKVAALALRHWRAERESLRRGRFRGLRLPERVSSPRTAVNWLLCARQLGQLLGHGLYAALLEDDVSREEIRELFQTPFAAVDARALYLTWIRRLDRRGFRTAAGAATL